MVGIQQEGVDVSHPKFLGSFALLRLGMVAHAVAILLALCCALPSLAQPGTDAVADGEISIEVLPQFVTTFRQGSWVPVDVLVNNNKLDVSGALEITLKNFDEPQSPVYRLPVESPKGSRKRFRMYCNLGSATQLEVMLYHGKRKVFRDPVRLALQPIDKNDVLALILDDEPADYGFIYNAVQQVSPGLTFHREGLHASELSQLPEYPQCYDPYTLIVLGRVDPGEIPERQRELLRRYVEHGGVVVLCVGENASRFKGTWIETLAGVSIGEVTPADERVFANQVFSAEFAQGARDGKSIVRAEITPAAGTYVQNMGGSATGTDGVLAVIRPLGSGHIVTIAVDAAGKALHGTAGFTELWSNLIELREEAAEPHYDLASWKAANALPSATGIRVYPRSSVLIYLGLYFAIGIVGNWIFWSMLKRREMAWVCLIFISFGFTAYALIYGTAGRAKATELSQLEVLRLPIDSPTAKLRSAVGIVAARSSRYTLSFVNAYPLVSDIEAGGAVMGMPQRPTLMNRINTFQFVQGPAAAVNNFTVGASEMRVVQIESEIASPGKIEGTLHWDANGIHGELTNNTGLNVRAPFLLANGKRLPLRVENNRWIADAPNAVLNARDPLQDVSNRYLMMGMGNYGGDLMDINLLREQFMGDLFASERNASFTDERVGPYVCGWIERLPFRSIDLGEPANERIYATLLLADVSIAVGEGAAPRRVELEADIALGSGPGQFDPNYYGGDSLRYSVASGRPLAIQITVPRSVRAAPESTLEIDVYSSGRDGDKEAKILFYPKGTNETWAAEHRGTTANEEIHGNNIQIATFTIEDWAARINSDTQQIEAVIAVKDGQVRDSFARVDLRAHLLVPQTQSYGGVWKPWQS
jgi:hypothetical protein